MDVTKKAAAILYATKLKDGVTVISAPKEVQTKSKKTQTGLDWEIDSV